MPATQSLVLPSGLRLHALRWDGSGRPFLLVHGLASNCRTWEAVGDDLAEAGHPAVAVDLRGHGRSDRPESGYEFPTLVSDLLALIDLLGWRARRPVVAGQSTGGNLAVELAAREPGAVGAVVGVDGGIIDLAARWASWVDCERALAPPPLEGLPASELEGMLRRSHPTWTDWGVSATLANLEVLVDGTVRPWLARDRHLRILRALWEQRPVELLDRLSVPVLLVLADGGDGWAEAKREAVARVPSAAPQAKVRVEWMAGDHDLHVEQPERVATLLVEAAGAATEAGL